MRRFLILLIFVLVIGFAKITEARKLALLVGVDEYAKIQSLRCCVNDMKALKQALKKIGFEESDIHILTTGDSSLLNLPLKQNIEQKVDEILSGAGSSDMVFFAFSGHGMWEDETDYFCPPYADPKDLKGTCVSINKVMDDLDKCRAKFKWMVVDACRSTPTNSREARGVEVIPAPPNGIALFQSCGKGQRSYEENREGGNGYFTKNLVAALSGAGDLDGDGKLTLLEVCKWTAARTKDEVNRMEKKIQTPFINISAADFVLFEDLNVQKAKALAVQGRALIAKGRYEDGIQLLNEAIKLSPRNSWKRDRDNAKIRYEQEKKLKEAERRAREAEQKAKEAAKMVPKPQSEPTWLRGTSSSSNDSESYSNSPRRAGDRMVLRADGIEYAFRWCPPGEFMMGSDKSDERPVHKVILTKGFWLLETEVTQAMWWSVIGKNPSMYKGDQKPVEQVYWDDCQEFCQKLSQKLGQQVMLPTEAQWEYACRAGTTDDYAGNLDVMAWYNKNTGWGAYAVGRMRPNAWGLYDMHGNVCEWCSDYFDEKYYDRSPSSDPENTTVSPYRVFRGGSWFSHAENCRSARRGRGVPGGRSGDLGLRVLVVPSQD